MTGLDRCPRRVMDNGATERGLPTLADYGTIFLESRSADERGTERQRRHDKGDTSHSPALALMVTVSLKAHARRQQTNMDQLPKSVLTTIFDCIGDRVSWNNLRCVNKACHSASRKDAGACSPPWPEGTFKASVAKYAIVLFSPNGEILACCGSNREGQAVTLLQGNGFVVGIWKRDIGHFVGLLYDHGFMSAMAFSHDSRRLVVAEGHWGTITIWDTTNWSRTRRWPNRATGRNRKIELIQFSQDGLTLLIVSNHFVTTLDSDTGASLKIVSMGQTMGRNMDCRLITANGHLVVFVNYRLERLTITNILQDPVETTQLTESTLGVRLSAGQFTADGKFFSVSSRSSDQCALRVFDVSNPPYECVRTITCPIFLPTTAAFLPNDNTKWVALHDDRRLRLWNVASGEHTVVATLPTRGNGDPLHIADLVVSPNGRVVVMTSPGGHDGHDKDVLHFVRLPSS